MGRNSPTNKHTEDSTIARALSILKRRLRNEPVFADPSSVRSFLQLKAQGLTHEVFGLMYLDTRHRLIEYEQLFRGSLQQAPVFPREIVRQALLKNAASVILHHNHPSGCCHPSSRDKELTDDIRRALDLVDVNVLDHVITSDCETFSMAVDGET